MVLGPAAGEEGSGYRSTRASEVSGGAELVRMVCNHSGTSVASVRVSLLAAVSLRSSFPPDDLESGQTMGEKQRSECQAAVLVSACSGGIGRSQWAGLQGWVGVGRQVEAKRYVCKRHSSNKVYFMRLLHLNA